MIKRSRWLAPVLLLALGWNLGLAATAYYTHLPVVFGQPVASACSSTAPLLDQDTGLLSAGYRDGQYILAYQDRAHGSLAHIVRHEGSRLVEIETQPIQSVFPGAAAPSFSPTGPKQGSLALVLNGPKNRLYYTQRVQDETPNEGPYGIWCLEW